MWIEFVVKETQEKTESEGNVISENKEHQTASRSRHTGLSHSNAAKHPDTFDAVYPTMNPGS